MGSSLDRRVPCQSPAITPSIPMVTLAVSKPPSLHRFISLASSIVCATLRNSYSYSTFLCLLSFCIASKDSLLLLPFLHFSCLFYFLCLLCLQLEQENACDFVTAALKNFPMDQEVQIEACGAVANLANISDDNRVKLGQ